MKLPSPKRTGHSRKAQYNRFTTYVIGLIGLLIGATFVLLSNASWFSLPPLQALANDGSSLAAHPAAVMRSSSNSLADKLGDYFMAGSQNTRLREELENSKIRIAELMAIEQENEQLKALLGIPESDTEPVLVTRVIGSTSTSVRRFALLSAGRNDGVSVGMPVRTSKGVIGRVFEVGQYTSKVLLITDSNSAIPIRRMEDNLVGFAEGRGDGTLRIKLLNLDESSIEPGTLFVTSGAGGYYQPGLPVAVVESVTNDGALARMVADPASETFVRIEPIAMPISSSIVSQADNTLITTTGVK